MSELYPIKFNPILKERIWGGTRLSDLYSRELPAGVPIGESWEICDRNEGVSIIANGKYEGQTLRWLMEKFEGPLLGKSRSQNGSFPLLIKILDAREKLSLQVHPPAGRAAELNGEPKTEMWFITHAEPEADLYVGLRSGVTPEEFEARIEDGSVAGCFHHIPVRKGDCMFLPSGRVHAIGAGNVIFEIQQNSDTTYRVFDWNRVGLDGKPRELHVEASLKSINFNDFEPSLARPTDRHPEIPRAGCLVDDALFTVWQCEWPETTMSEFSTGNYCHIIGVYEGSLEIDSSAACSPVSLVAGQFCLIPASLEKVRLKSDSSAFLVAKAG